MESVVIVTSKGQLTETVEAAVQRAVSCLGKPTRDHPPKAFLTNREAQEYLGLSKATLARYRADGTLPYSKVGQSVFYRLADIEAVLERHAVASPTAAA
ncbi:helix-turn-helix domain-containing protein [Rubrivirga sp.]|uniref:helix-turn-helix domain-containing protein n=1 Tax=Rubrivirga sp. TaxID=1885344 RepID=UPI003C737540